jgi:hypothetical protein
VQCDDDGTVERSTRSLSPIRNDSTRWSFTDLSVGLSLHQSRSHVDTFIERPSMGSGKLWEAAIGMMIVILIPCGVSRWLGADMDLITPLAGYSIAGAWTWANFQVMFLAGSFVYFFVTRKAGVVPWRLGSFIRSMRNEGVLQQDGEDLRVMHDRIYRYLRDKARYRWPN